MIELYNEFFLKIFINIIQYDYVKCDECILYSIDHYTNIDYCPYSPENKGKTSCGNSRIIWSK